MPSRSEPPMKLGGTPAGRPKRCRRRRCPSALNASSSRPARVRWSTRTRLPLTSASRRSASRTRRVMRPVATSTARSSSLPAASKPNVTSRCCAGQSAAIAPWAGRAATRRPERRLNTTIRRRVRAANRRRSGDSTVAKVSRGSTGPPRRAVKSGRSRRKGDPTGAPIRGVAVATPGVRTASTSTRSAKAARKATGIVRFI